MPKFADPSAVVGFQYDTEFVGGVLRQRPAKQSSKTISPVFHQLPADLHQLPAVFARTLATASGLPALEDRPPIEDGRQDRVIFAALLPDLLEPPLLCAFFTQKKNLEGHAALYVWGVDIPRGLVVYVCGAFEGARREAFVEAFGGGHLEGHLERQGSVWGTGGTAYRRGGGAFGEAFGGAFGQPFGKTNAPAHLIGEANTRAPCPSRFFFCVKNAHNIPAMISTNRRSKLPTVWGLGRG